MEALLVSEPEVLKVDPPRLPYIPLWTGTPRNAGCAVERITRTRGTRQKERLWREKPQRRRT